MEVPPPSDQSLLHVANYPAGAAFFISAYKIYAVYPAKRYKSNIFSRIARLPSRYGAKCSYIASR
jgi:hypothetical protein